MNVAECEFMRQINSKREAVTAGKKEGEGDRVGSESESENLYKS